MQLQSRMDNIVQNCWDGYEWLLEELWLFTGVIETWYPSFLAVSKACPGMGWRMCVELIIGCAQPDGWKITSVEPNVEWFLSGGGSKGGHIRSL